MIIEDVVSDRLRMKVLDILLKKLFIIRFDLIDKLIDEQEDNEKYILESIDQLISAGYLEQTGASQFDNIYLTAKTLGFKRKLQTFYQTFQ